MEPVDSIKLQTFNSILESIHTMEREIKAVSDRYIKYRSVMDNVYLCSLREGRDEIIKTYNKMGQYFPNFTPYKS